MPGRSPRQHIGDVGRVAVEADRRQHPVEQLPASADEGKTLAILFGPGRLAHQHDVGLRIAVREHQIGGCAFQGAILEPVEGGAQFGQTGRGAGAFTRVGGGGLGIDRHGGARLDDGRALCRGFASRLCGGLLRARSAHV